MTKIFKKYYLEIIFLAAAAAIAVSLPYVNFMRSANFNMADPWAINLNSGGYYMARLHEISDGNPFLGNPFFIEHQKEIAPAFFVADWLAYAPVVFGLPLKYLTLFNHYFWAIVFILLSFVIFLKLGIKKEISALGALAVFFIGFNLIIDTVSMQTIYPFYLLAFLAFYLWQADTAGRTRQIFLILSLTACFYVYTYLWQLALTVSFLYLAYFLFLKKKAEFWELIKILAAVFILSAPLFIYTFSQLAHPFYWQTMTRIGLAQTYLPTAEVIYFGRWILLSLAFWLGLIFLNRRESGGERLKQQAVYFSLTGLSLLIVAASNLLTGKDLELAQHIVRFAKLWLGLSLVSLFYRLYQGRAAIRPRLKNNWARLAAVLALVILTYGTAGYLNRPRLIDYLSRQNDDRLEYEALNWLEKNETKPVVVMADYKSEFNKNVPVMTKHYVLFSAAGVLHLLADREAEERYLLNGTLNGLSLAEIKNDFPLYAGNGNATHPYLNHNRGVKLCRTLRLNLFNCDCGQLTDSISFKGEEYFARLYSKYREEILVKAGEEFKKFKVAYVVADKRQTDFLSRLKTVKLAEVYQNENYIIYKVL